MRGEHPAVVVTKGMAMMPRGTTFAAERIIGKLREAAAGVRSKTSEPGEATPSGYEGGSSGSG